MEQTGNHDLVVGPGAAGPRRHLDGVVAVVDLETAVELRGRFQHLEKQVSVGHKRHYRLSASDPQHLLQGSRNGNQKVNRVIQPSVS